MGPYTSPLTVGRLVHIYMHPCITTYSGAFSTYIYAPGTVQVGCKVRVYVNGIPVVIAQAGARYEDRTVCLAICKSLFPASTADAASKTAVMPNCVITSRAHVLPTGTTSRSQPSMGHRRGLGMTGATRLYSPKCGQTPLLYPRSH